MYLQNTHEHSLLQGLEALQPQPGEVLLLLLAEKSATDVEAVVRFFNEREIPFFGGLFPGLIHADQHLETGCILKKFKALAPPFVVQNISKKSLEELSDLHIPDLDDRPTTIILLDGLTSNINYFLEGLNNQIGDRVNFIGGGAGSCNLKQQLCLFNNDGFFKDAAICCVLSAQSSLGVQHGWEKMGGPLVATCTTGSTITQLNWQNAFEVYKSYLENGSETSITNENFLNHSKDHPFGIFRENADYIMRDPVGLNDQGEVTCIGEVNPNTVLYIMKSTPELLIEAASQAMRECMENAGASPFATFVVDCITRHSVLGDRYPEELSAIRSQLNIQSSEQEPFGILSLGEISSHGNGVLEFFSKTVVVGTFQN